MITWLEPVIRGGMMFTAQTVSTGESSGATNAETRNVTGTTVTGSYSYAEQFVTGAGTATGYSTSTSGTSGSDSYQMTLGVQTSTTFSYTGKATTTCLTAIESTKWTTESQKEDQDSKTFRFTTTEQVVAETSTSFFTETKTGFSTTETDTAIGNVYDTVVLCDFSEIAMVQTKYVSWKEWDGAGQLAVHTETGTRVTITADVANTAMEAFDFENTQEQEQEEQATTVQIDYSAYGSEYETTTLTLFDHRNLCSEEVTQLNVRPKLETTSIAQGFGYPSFTHVGNTTTQIAMKTVLTTEMAILEHGQTFPTLADDIVPGFAEKLLSATVTVENGYTFQTGAPEEGVMVVGGGNTTFVDQSHLQLQCFPQFGDIGDRYDNRIPGICYIVKPFGVIDGEQLGAYAMLKNTSFADVDYVACVSRQVPFLNFEYPRALRTITTTSNESYTISGPSITYTVEGSTSSEKILVAGECPTGIVATKNVLGGIPEKYATFYQSAPNGVFSVVNSTGWTTTCMNGEMTTASHLEILETMALVPVPYLTFSGQEALIFGNQIIPVYTYERYE